MSHQIGIVPAVVIAIAIAIPAHAQSIPDYDFQWATIGDVGNPTFGDPIPGNYVYGSGRVDYEYRISKMEVTAGQWVEFLNAFTMTDDPRFRDFGFPYDCIVIGTDVDYKGPGDRWRVYDQPDGVNEERVPLQGVTWRMAAMFCNWLHNDKQGTWEALNSGAYDTSTFGDNPDGTHTDQPEHSPGAKFWIPTWNEWTKAMYYDPDRNGPGEGGYWLYPNSSDTRPAAGYPGEPGAETGAGLQEQRRSWLIPLGSYPDEVSPWGLLDGSGGGQEWTEFGGPNFGGRFIRGTPAGPGGEGDWERITRFSSGEPGSPGASFRIASVVPSPGLAESSIVFGLITCSSRRRRTLVSAPGRSRVT